MCIKLDHHPRLRGEKRKAYMDKLEDAGSPPLTRGKGSNSLLKMIKARITPAYAGKSFPSKITYFWVKDHPRLRGEKELFDILLSLCFGSPPLTRGKGKIARTVSMRLRITPAYAGKSCFVCLKRRRSEDHPRLRGEKLASSLDISSRKGSPPLTRGKASSTTS